jgi:hypothetical protein
MVSPTFCWSFPLLQVTEHKHCTETQPALWRPHQLLERYQPKSQSGTHGWLLTLAFHLAFFVNFLIFVLVNMRHLDRTDACVWFRELHRCCMLLLFIFLYFECWTTINISISRKFVALADDTCCYGTFLCVFQTYLLKY